MKSKNTVRALIGEHRNTRAAGMPSDRRQDHFEKIVAHKLSNVKGIDLDGDGVIDDDELEYAKELEARVIRANDFCNQVKSTGKDLFATGWFGKQYVNKSQSEIVTTLAKDNHFEVKLGKLFGRLKTYKLTLSHDVAAAITPRNGYGGTRPDSRWGAGRKKKLEEKIYKHHQRELQKRTKLLHENPLRAQPSSYMEMFTSINPITGKYVFEEDD